MSHSTKTASELSADAKKMYAESAARSLEALVSRLKADKEFVSALEKSPRQALDSADIRLEKEAIELLIATDPGRFDRACDSLFEILDPNLLSKLVDPSCGISIKPDKNSYGLKFVPRSA
ncbi:hypothetical protein [Burkholderia sp. Bp9142]|uniref:hypothetical protein n=1 Tax=Burkholderia sp. Bp9142 TaxID=2184573 RepID=UPI000F5ACEA2|nr:hypothetical protein [Burkholderia sp. Bp9142]RQR40629.1 hypothetical protein DIE22_05050 [Burkholderia sp. Bp9142]